MKGDGTMEELLTLTHATERDIDILLVEELQCSKSFVSWFLQLIGSQLQTTTAFSSSRVIHSRRRTHNRREIDICLVLKDANESVTMILVENKLDTQEQARQAESYQDEIDVLLRRGAAQRAFTALVCPRGYAQQNPGFAAKFQAVVHYEDVREHLRQRATKEKTELKQRLRFRADLLDQAINKHRRGYEAVPVLAIQRFNEQYIELCKIHAPELIPGTAMRRKDRPGESVTMIFDRMSLPAADFLPQMRIVHQLREGNANVNFYTWGDYYGEIVTLLEKDLSGTPYRTQPTRNMRKGGRSGLMIYVPTPTVDNQKGVEEQLDSIVAGIKSTQSLRSWIVSNLDRIKRWSEVVKELDSTRNS